MAEYTEDIQKIKVDVNAIQKRFGSKIKQPSDSTKNDNEEKEVDLMELLLRGMSSALYDTTTIADNDSAWISLFNKPGQSLLHQIKQSIDALKTPNTGNSSTQKIIFDSTNSNFIDLLVNLDKIKDVDTNTQKIINGLHKLNDVLSNSKIKNELQNLSSSFSEAFLNFNVDKEKIRSIYEMTSALSNIMNLLSNNAEINTKNLKEIHRQLSKSGYLYKIIDDLSKIYEQRKIIDVSFSYLKELIEAITLVGNINPIQRLFIKSNLKYIHNEIIDFIKLILDDIKDLKSENKDLYKALMDISDLFDTIYKISGGEKIKKIRTKINLEYIRFMIVPSMLKIIDDLNKVANKATKEGSEAIDNINKIFDNIFKIGSYSFLQLIKFDLKTQYFRDIISMNIKEGIIEEIIEMSETHYNDLSNIIDLFNHISEFIDIIDSIEINLKNLLKVDEIGFLFNRINKMTLLKDEQIRNFDNLKVILQKFTSQYLFQTKDLNDISINIKKCIDITKDIETLINSIPKDLKDISTYANLQIVINSLLGIFNSYENNDYQYIENFVKALDNIDKFILTLEDIDKHIGNINFDYLTKFVQNENLKNFLKEFEEGDNDNNIISHINKIKISGNVKKKLESINDLLATLSTLNKLSKISILFKVASLKPYEKLVKQVVGIIDTINTNIKNNKEVERATKVLREMTILIGVAAGIMIVGAIAFKYASWKGILMFPIVFVGFLFGLMRAIKLLSDTKFDESLLATLDKMSEFVIKCGAVLVFGSLVMNLVRVEDLLSFGLSLTLFIIAMTTCAAMLAAVFDKENLKIKSLDVFREFVVQLGALMIIGSLLTQFVELTDLLIFGVATIVFVGLMAWLASKINENFGEDKKIFDNLNKFKDFVVTCASVMLFGSLVMKLLNPIDIFLFTTALMGFIALTILPFWIFGNSKRKVFENAKDFTVLVAVSAAVMIFGAFFAKQEDFVLNSLKFGLALAGFIFLIMLPFKLINNVAAVVAEAGAITLLVAVCGGMLLFAGYLISNNPGLLKNVALFGLTLLGFIIITGLIVVALGYCGPYLVPGFLAVGGIMLIMAAGIMLFEYINSKQDKIDIKKALHVIFGNFKQIIIEIVELWKFIFGFENEDVTLGSFISKIFDGSIVQGVLKLGAIGTGFMLVGTLSVLMLIAVGSMSLIQKSLEGMNVALIGTKIEQLFGVYKTLITSINESFSLGDIYEAWKGMKIINLISEGLGHSAESLKLWADLKFPTKFDPKTGEPIEFATIATGDFTKVSNNISQVLTALGTAIVTTAKNNTDIFGDWGIFRDSPAMNAAKVIGAMGRSLIPVAQGIKEWVNLKIPVKFDNNGNPTEYQTIHEKDFGEASKHIQQVLVCLGRAIVEAIGKNKDIFNDGMISDSPAMNAAKAIGVMGNTLKNIAFVIGEFASNKFYALDKEGNPIGDPITFDQGDYDKILGKGKEKGVIEKILTCLGQAIINTIGKNEKLFNDKTFSKSPAIVAANAIKGMSDALLNVVEVIQKINKDPQFNDKEITETLNQIETKIEKIITSIVKTSSTIKDIFSSKQYSINDDDSTGVEDVFNWLSGKSQIEITESNVKELNDTLGSLGQNIKTILTITGTLTEFSKILKENEDFNVDIGTLGEKIKSAIWNINNIQRSLLGIITSRKNSNNEIVDIDKSYDKINSTLNLLLDTFKILNEIAEYSNKKSIKNVNGIESLSKGISELLNKLVGKETELNNFKQLSNDTKEFIEHINSLDINKANTLQSLIKAMTELSEKVKSLDKLAEIFSEKITAVLYELTLQLRKAEAVITDAHELQEYRRKLINESIDKVTNIMNQHMVVEVYKKKDDGELGYNGANNYKPTDTNTPSGNTDMPSAATTSAEDATPQPPEMLRRDTSSNTDDVLTVQRFIKEMQNNLDKFWGK